MEPITILSIYILSSITTGYCIYNYVEYHSHIWYKQFEKQMPR